MQAAGARPQLAALSRANWFAIALATIAGAGVVLRFYGLGSHYLSYDEAFTMLMAGRSLPDLIRAAAGDVHPPLSYMIYWLTLHALGASNFTLRLPAAVMGCASLWQAYGLMRRLSFSRPALLAGFALFALSPFEIHYSQDARMYGLLQLAVLGAVLALLDRRYIHFGAWLAVALWTHNYGLIYGAVIGAAYLFRELQRPVIAAFDPALGWRGPQDSSEWRRVLIAGALALASWLPWAGVLVAQMHTLSAGYWIEPLSIGGALYPLFPLLWGVALPAELNGLAAAVAVGLVVFAMLKALKLRRYRFLLWLTLAPAVIAAAVSLVSTPIYLYRAFAPVVAPLCALIGWAVTEGTGWRERAWALVVVGVLVGLGLWYRSPVLQEESAENTLALQAVLKGYQPGDVVLHGNVGTLSGFLASGPAWLPNYLMTVQPGSVGVLTPQTREALGFCEGDIEPRVLVTTCGRVGWRRVWLVWGAAQTISGAEDAAIAAILARYPNVKELDVHDIYHGPQPVDGGIWLLTTGGD